MSRIVTALYETRAEAETARARLTFEVQADTSRIVGKDSIAALDDIALEQRDLDSYRDSVRSGGHLLVANVADGQSADRIVALLEQSIRSEAAAPARDPSGALLPADCQQLVEEARIPEVSETLRVGKREVTRGGAKVRAFVREVPAEATATLRQEQVEVGSRPAERFLSDAEIECAGLLKDRVVEFSEMREEAVVTKDAFVREEIILRKSVDERTEVIRDTVRRTEVEVEEFTASGDRVAGPIADPQGRPTGR
jgi:stress response protein YsnF